MTVLRSMRLGPIGLGAAIGLGIGPTGDGTLGSWPGIQPVSPSPLSLPSWRGDDLFIPYSEEPLYGAAFPAYLGPLGPHEGPIDLGSMLRPTVNAGPAWSPSYHSDLIAGIMSGAVTRFQGLPITAATIRRDLQPDWEWSFALEPVPAVAGSPAPPGFVLRGKQRPVGVTAGSRKRRAEGKVHGEFYRSMLGRFNATYGRASEGWDAAEALASNVWINRPATGWVRPYLKGASVIHTLGSYYYYGGTIDWNGFVTDFTLNQFGDLAYALAAPDRWVGSYRDNWAETIRYSSTAKLVRKPWDVWVSQTERRLRAELRPSWVRSRAVRRDAPGWWGV